MKLLISLNHESTKPIYRQIVEELRIAIDQGVLQLNEKLPSTRDLAEDLGISRFTVMRSYEDLASCGYIKIATGSGAYVTKGAEIPAPAIDSELSDFSPPFNGNANTSWIRERKSAASPAIFGDSPELDYNSPNSDMLPEARWKQALYKAIQIRECEAAKQPPFGSLKLREALAAYLRTARRVICQSGQIIIFDSWQSALDFLVDMLVQADDLCLVENPGHPAFSKTIEEKGAKASPLSIEKLHSDSFDCENYSEAEILALAKLIMVSPQRNPISGRSLTEGERERLLDFLFRSRAYLIENDGDHEYHYSARRTPSLQGIDASKRTIYMGTAARVMGGLTTLAYVVLPESLLSEAKHKLSINGMNVSAIEQEALAVMIGEGHFERHIKRTFQSLATRRAAAIHALTVRFAQQVKIQTSAGGTSLSILFSPQFSLANLSTAAEQAGLSMLYTGMRHQSPAFRNEFLLSFGSATEKQLDEKITLMHSLLTVPQPRDSSEIKALEFALTSALY